MKTNLTWELPAEGLIRRGDETWDRHEGKWVPCKPRPGLKGSARVENNLPVRRRALSTQWIDADVELPDDEMIVLLALDDGDVWTGFHEEGRWHYVSADNIAAKVTHWAEFPPPPHHS